jgi:hypothetical protein
MTKAMNEAIPKAQWRATRQALYQMAGSQFLDPVTLE